MVPGLAIAEALVAAGVDRSSIHWVGSRRGMEVDAVPAAGFALDVLPGRGIVRSFSLANVANIAGLIRATAMGVWIVGRQRPAAVVSLGGYAAVPCAVGAVLFRRPLVIQEQNATPSLANRLVSRFAKVASVPVAGTGLRRELVTGNPVSQAIRSVDRDAAAARSALGLPLDRTVIAAFGGSLGARRINHAVLDLAERWADRSDLAIHHVIGRRDWPDLVERIRALEGSKLHYQAVEYEQRMPQVLVAADVSVCRAGGMTVAELTVLGCPAILVPLPIAPNDAQRANAAAMQQAGAAVVVDDEALDAALLDVELTKLLGGDLEAASAAASALGRPDAADDIAAAIMDAAGPSGAHS